MKIKSKIALSTILLISVQTMFAQELVKSQEKIQSVNLNENNIQLDSPCPVGAPSNPNPPN